MEQNELNSRRSMLKLPIPTAGCPLNVHAFESCHNKYKAISTLKPVCITCSPTVTWRSLGRREPDDRRLVHMIAQTRMRPSVESN